MRRLGAPLLLLMALLPVSSQGGEFSGYGEAKGFVYGERTDRSDPRGLGWGTLFAKWEEKLRETQITASMRAEWISGDEQGGRLFDPADREIRRPPFSVRDLWVRHPLSPSIDVQAGRFQLGWGKTDGYSPADAFLPRDLSDPFADEKIPLWAIRLSGQEGTVRYEAVGCPVTTPWRLPPLGSRNAPISADAIPDGAELREVDSSVPVEGFAALRVLASFGDWDVGAWGRVGVRPAPLLEFRADQAVPGSSGVAILIERRYAREQAVGVEVSRVLDSWVVRGEVAGLFSRDRDLGDAVIGALSAERGFGDGTLLVTLAGNAIDPPVDETLLFDRALLPALIAAWNWTEEWGEWKVVSTSGLKRGDGLVKGEIGYNVTDTWKVIAGGELPYGSKRGALGALQDARRIHAALRLSW